MQETLYSITADEQLAEIRRIAGELAALEQMHSENLDQRKAINDSIVKKETELKLALAGGKQANLDMQPLKLDTTDCETNKEIKERRRAEVQKRALMALKAAPGGRMSGKGLASLIGVNPHGLDGLLVGAEGFEKVHDGRVGNEQTHYVLKKA